VTSQEGRDSNPSKVSRVLSRETGDEETEEGGGEYLRVLKDKKVKTVLRSWSCSVLWRV
jgi:hypothetical protein